MAGYCAEGDLTAVHKQKLRLSLDAAEAVNAMLPRGGGE
jgi:hypothetical protein